MKYMSWPKVFVGICVVSLSACGVFKSDDGAFRDRDKDYLKTGSIKAIDLPEGVESVPLQPLYPVPEVYAVDEFGDTVNLVDYEIPRPDAASSDEEVYGVKLQKLGDDRWISLGVSTSQVWPRTQSFLTTADVDVSRADAKAGVIETDWVQFKTETNKKARFRVLLEKGVHPDTTEIHVRQVEFPVEEEVPYPMEWPAKSTNDEREEWMVRELANHLAASIDNASASLLGQNVGGPLKAGFVAAAIEPTLRLRLSADRAWATLIHAARQETFRTWESDKNLGVIFVDYSEDFVKKRGFFGKMAFWNRLKKPTDTARYSLEAMLKHLSGAKHVRELFDGIEGVDYAAGLEKSEGYLIVIKTNAEYSNVVIRDYRGRMLPAAQAKVLLKTLRKNLI